ncbi:hypothetical protein [Reticulibacter mediterranei]|uniref:hypothetical protein n=1 Tax=Reticulibacter mediterranei TaxID=2778369 RepID=UPI001C691977|nr:hypothetical protein [Reticulibacter mediterranei]
MIEAADLPQTDAALKLALKYRTWYLTTATQETSKSTIKVEGQIPARKRRRRR